MKRSLYLSRARRWAVQVRKARTKPDKRRAAHEVCLALTMLTSGRAPLELAASTEPAA
jgi:hypothetical protein